MEKSIDLLEWVNEPTDIMSGKAYAYSLIFTRLTPPEISINIFFVNRPSSNRKWIS